MWPSSEIAEICVTNRDGSDLRCLTDDRLQNGIPAWSPDGRWIAFISMRGGNPGIDLIDVNDGTRRSLITGVTPSGRLMWSPDGSRLVFQANAGEDVEIYTIEVVTQEGNTYQLTRVQAFDGAPVWAH